MNDGALVEEPDNQVEAAEVDAATGPTCEKCDQPVADAHSSVCPHCGWYPSAGTFVEIDADWEAAASNQPTVSQQPKSHLEVWLTLLPKWVWVNWACGAAAIVMSIAARVLLTDEALRSTWSVWQLFIGIAVAMMCHLTVYILMAMDDPDLGIGDVVISPLKGWKKLFGQMPRHQWVACLFNFAMSSSVGAMLIIGGIPYEKVWDWGIKPPAKKDLLGAIADAAGGGGGDQSMEDSMKSFAQDAAVKGGGGKGLPEGETPEEYDRKDIDALILGYKLDQNGKLHTLFLATEVNGMLLYAGRVNPEFEPEEADEVLKSFRANPAMRPLVSAPDDGYWVKPRFTCRVSYFKRVESGRLQGLMWGEMLGEVEVP